jgi:hypothetical protein
VRFYLGVIVIFKNERQAIFIRNSCRASPFFYARCFFYRARGEMYHHRVASEVITTTEVIGETNVTGNKTPLCILIDTGSSSSIILKKFINKNTLVINKKTTTE